MSQLGFLFAGPVHGPWIGRLKPERCKSGFGEPTIWTVSVVPRSDLCIKIGFWAIIKHVYIILFLGTCMYLSWLNSQLGRKSPLPWPSLFLGWMLHGSTPFPGPPNIENPRITDVTRCLWGPGKGDCVKLGTFTSINYEKLQYQNHGRV